MNGSRTIDWRFNIHSQNAINHFDMRSGCPFVFLTDRKDIVLSFIRKNVSFTKRTPITQAVRRLKAGKTFSSWLKHHTKNVRLRYTHNRHYWMFSGKSGGATALSNISALSWLIVTDAFNQSVFRRKGNYMAWTPSWEANSTSTSQGNSLILRELPCSQRPDICPCSCVRLIQFTLSSCQSV
jgi:hypothetical protein